MCCKRPAPMRFAPFSYFCTCWDVSPSSSPSFSWLIPSIIRRIRIRLPTCLSTRLGAPLLNISTSEYSRDDGTGETRISPVGREGGALTVTGAARIAKQNLSRCSLGGPRSACRGARSSRTNLGDIDDDLIPGVTAAIAHVHHVPQIGVVFVPLGAGEPHRLEDRPEAAAGWQLYRAALLAAFHVQPIAFRPLSLIRSVVTSILGWPCLFDTCTVASPSLIRLTSSPIGTLCA